MSDDFPTRSYAAASPARTASATGARQPSSHQPSTRPQPRLRPCAEFEGTATLRDEAYSQRADQPRRVLDKRRRRRYIYQYARNLMIDSRLEPQNDEVEIRVAHLSSEHVGHRVRFRRPRNSPAGYPIVSGQLIRVDQQEIWRGTMRQMGYALTIAFPGRTGTYDEVTLGPLSIMYPILVGPKWVRRPVTVDPDLQRKFERLKRHHRPDAVL